MPSQLQNSRTLKLIKQVCYIIRRNTGKPITNLSNETIMSEGSMRRLCRNDIEMSFYRITKRPTLSEATIKNSSIGVETIVIFSFTRTNVLSHHQISTIAFYFYGKLVANHDIVSSKTCYSTHSLWHG